MPPLTHVPRIVVHGERTAAAADALRWAVREAEARRAAVVVVRPFDLSCRADLALERDLGRARRDARYRTQAWVVEVVGDLDTDVPVVVSTPDGSPEEALLACAADADLVVLGDSGEESQRLAATLRERTGSPVRLIGREVTVR